MSFEYQILIDMEQETVEALDAGGYSLYAFKAVAAAQEGSPVVWFATQAYSVETQVTWDDAYQAYTSLEDIIAGGEIVASFALDIELGQTLVVETSKGTGEVVGGGDATALTVRNETETAMTCGLAGEVASRSNQLCAFALSGLGQDVFTPLEKLLLMFAQQTLEVGMVVEEAPAVCVLVDLTEDNQRSLDYDINAGWSWGDGAWATQYAAGTELTPLLIEIVADTRQVGQVHFERRAPIAV